MSSEFVDEQPRQNIVASPSGWNLQKNAGTIRLLQNPMRQPLAYPAFLFDPLTGKAFNSANPLPVSGISVTIADIGTLTSITDPVTTHPAAQNIAPINSGIFSGVAIVNTNVTGVLTGSPGKNIYIKTIQISLSEATAAAVSHLTFFNDATPIFIVALPVMPSAVIINVDLDYLAQIATGKNFNVQASALTTGTIHIVACGASY